MFQIIDIAATVETIVGPRDAHPDIVFSRRKHKLDPKVPRANTRAGMVRRTKK